MHGSERFVLIATVAAGTLAAIAVQVFRGYTRVELGNYLAWYVLPWTIDVAADRRPYNKRVDRNSETMCARSIGFPDPGSPYS